MHTWTKLQTDKGRLNATREAFQKLLENEDKQSKAQLFSDCQWGCINPAWKHKTKGFAAFQKETGILLDGAWQILQKQNPRLQLSKENTVIAIHPAFCRKIYQDVSEAIQATNTPKQACDLLNSNGTPGIGCNFWVEDALKHYAKQNNLWHLTKKEVSTW